MSRSVFILICLLCGSCALVYLFSREHPHAALYGWFQGRASMARRFERQHRVRANLAEEYFHKQDTAPFLDRKYTDNKSKNNSHNIRLVVGIITTRRRGDSYFLQAASRIDYLLKGSSLSHFTTSLVFTCNVDGAPELHLDARSVYRFLPHTERFGQTSVGFPPLTTLTSQDSFFVNSSNHISKYQKETLDYVFCLHSAAAFNSSFIILLEDDAIALSDFPDVLHHLLTSRLKHSRNEYLKNGFAFVRMFYPTSYQGFFSHFSFVGPLDLIAMSVLGSCLIHGLNVGISRFKNLYQPRGLCQELTVCFVLTMILCLLIGRQNINELRRLAYFTYRLEASQSHSTLAMLYPSYIVQPLSSFMVKADPKMHTDMVLDDFVRTATSLPALQIEPNLFRHVGLSSSMHPGHVSPEEFLFEYSTWRKA